MTSISKQLVVMTESPSNQDVIWTTLKEHSVSKPIPINADIDIDVEEEFYWRLIGEESGGSGNSNGVASIICGENGEPLKPFFIGKIANGIHARFLSTSMFDVYVRKEHESKYSIEVNRYKIDKISGKTDTTLIWKLENIDRDYILNNIPQTVIYLQHAIQSAMMKVDCFHCKSTHYSREEKKNGN